MRTGKLWAFMASLAALFAGCGSDSTGGSGDGNLSVLIGVEETIPDGLQAGDGEENIRDGFDISYSRYIVTLGNVEMSQLDGANFQSSAVVVVADLTSLPSTLPELTSFDGIPTGQYTSFGFETPPADADVVNLNAIEEADIDAMIANGWSYIIEGTITQVSDGASKDFLIEADVPSVYSDCAVEGLEPDVNVSSNSSVTCRTPRC